jgi:transposase-like protein
MGQHSTYTEELAAEIVERISTGETLRAICRDEHMPAWRTVYDWLREHKEFAAAIAHARELGYDAIAEETIEMVDATPERCETQFGDKVDAGYVQWQKNRVEQRLKLLAKWSPKKYGEKLEIEGKVEIGVTERLSRARNRTG